MMSKFFPNYTRMFGAIKGEFNLKAGGSATGALAWIL